MSESLIFFNKEGDSLNFKYDQFDERFEGDILFHENSSDTYKTFGLYTMEKVPSIEFESPSRLSLDKFQLFNEFGIHFYQKTLDKQIIKNIEPVNNDWNFYSKWIYGDNFDIKYPIGTLVSFNNAILEFTDEMRVYTVISSKKDAIMIISDVDNATFELKYSSIYTNPTTWEDLYLLNSVNSIGIYDYVNSKFENNLSNWNEPNFYDKLFNGKKLNVVNTNNNNGTYTISNTKLIDLLHFEYSTTIDKLPTNSKLIIEVITKSDLPRIYDGELEIKDNRIYFNNFLDVPSNLKPGSEFTISGSQLNKNYYTISNVPVFSKNLNLTYYATQSQVIYNNQIWECVKAYTQDQINNSSITPENSEYWNKTSFLPIKGSINKEYIQKCQIYLTTNKDYFEYNWTLNAKNTFSSTAEKYRSNLELYNIDLYFSNDELKADLKYSSKYAEVNFYHTEALPSNLISTTIQKNERLIEVQESLNTEMNYNYSNNSKYNIIFTDIDDWGIKLTINGQIYESDVIWIYNAGEPDLERTIDRTLRNWLTINYVKLYTLGIVSEIDFIGNYSDFQNSIILKTFFPNVPISLKVEVGTGGDYYVENSILAFKNISNLSNLSKLLTIDINDKLYTINTSISIQLTLSNWVVKHKSTLLEYGIIVTYINNSIKVDTKYPDRRLDIKINIGKIQIPGNEDFFIINKNKSNTGIVISSNEITLKDDEIDTRNFENIGLSTGMLISINNSGFVYDNQEYNIQYVDKNKVGLSYQGPFWGLTNSIYNSSAYSTLGFNLGFGITASYTPDFIKNSDLNLNHFNKTLFSAKIDSTIKGVELLEIETYVDNIYDIITVQLSNSYYVLAKKLTSTILLKVDSTTNKVKNIINLGLETTEGYGLKLEFNKFDNLIYCLLSKSIIRVDPIVDISSNITKFTKTPKYLSSNHKSGYKYIIFIDGTISILNNYNVEVVNTLSTTATINNNVSGKVYTDTILINGDITTSIKIGSEFNFTYNTSTGTGKWTGKAQSVTYDTNSNITTIQPNYSLNSAPILGNINQLNSIKNTLNSVITTTGLNGILNVNLYNIKWNEKENKSYIISDNKIFQIDSTITKLKEFTLLNLNKDFIHYDSINDSIIIKDSSNNLYRILNDILTPINTKGNIVLTNTIGSNLITTDGSLIKFINGNNQVEDSNTYTSTPSLWSINYYDSFIYVYETGKITILDLFGKTLKSIPLANGSKLIFNTDKNSMLISTLNKLYEIQVYYDNVIDYMSLINESINDDMYGTLNSDYKHRDNIWLKTREYVRKPRENYIGEVPVKYYWQWLTDENTEFFLYDISGDQISTGTSSYVYNGSTPLIDVPLNKNPNKDLNKVSLPEFQQNVFNVVTKSLDYINDSENFSSEPEAIELFVGFKSNEEGSKSSILQMYKKEDIEFNINSTSSNGTILKFNTLGLVVPSTDTDKRGVITIDSIGEYFTGRGLKPGQLISIYFKDLTNKENQYTSKNNGSIFKIREVYSKELVVDFLNIAYDMLYPEESVLYYPTTSKTYLGVTFKVLDKEIGRFTVYGQTEIEDFRFKTQLNNIGKNISPNDIFIFKDYDIYEGGIDWTFLNKKRKELLLMRNEIFPYIGSYKSIINAINYFGYNDLKLNEYYKNIDTKSSNFLKLFKIEIPDIFDNTIEGWNDNDFLKHTMPNENYEETNLFNLSYDITDKSGEIKINYTLDEVTIKLQGLKGWLKKNIIPITHKILDVTGNSYLNTETNISHKLSDVRIFKNRENMTPISFKLNESYLMPVNSGSTVYNCVLDLYTIINNKMNIKPHNDYSDNIVLPDYFDIKIRTWKTYKEWEAFTEYSKGDKIIYYGNIYESTINSNKMNSPIKWESLISDWDSAGNYETGNIVRYENEYYSYTGLGNEIENPITYETDGLGFNYPPPSIDNGDGYNWVIITEWRKISYEPVQTINEYRKGDNITPFNFTIDANIDPFVTIELTCDNGYGMIYRDRKNYEIRTLKDLSSPIRYIEPIGPFEPISYIK